MSVSFNYSLNTDRTDSTIFFCKLFNSFLHTLLYDHVFGCFLFYSVPQFIDPSVPQKNHSYPLLFIFLLKCLKYHTGDIFIQFCEITVGK